MTLDNIAWLEKLATCEPQIFDEPFARAATRESLFPASSPECRRTVNFTGFLIDHAPEKTIGHDIDIQACIRLVPGKL
jgi:hypothetical protein